MLWKIVTCFLINTMRVWLKFNSNLSKNPIIWSHLKLNWCVSPEFSWFPIKNVFSLHFHNYSGLFAGKVFWEFGSISFPLSFHFEWKKLIKWHFREMEIWIHSLQTNWNPLLIGNHHFHNHNTDDDEMMIFMFISWNSSDNTFHVKTIVQTCNFHNLTYG